MHDGEITAVTVLVEARSETGMAKEVGFEPVRKLLNHYWRPTNFNYRMLTKTEQSFITEDQFNALLPWLQGK